MASIKLNARDMVIEVSDGATTPVWTEIAGLTKFTYDPSENEETADTTTFVSDGNYEQEKMQKGAKASVEGFRIADGTTGAPDAGQAQVEEWHELLGPASVGTFRFRHVLDDEWKVWNATATVGEIGGENNDKSTWSAEFMRSGASSTVAVAP